MIANADWYFDFISPFSYLQFKQLGHLPQGLAITFKPMLFAGLLEHWEHKGPAEIPGKRKFTYRFVQWRAKELGIALKFPPAHPFNPIQMLRLAVALDSRREVIGAIFDFIWRDGNDVTDSGALSRLAGDLKIDSIESLVGNKAVKDKLIQNGQDAIQAGVFGVPTFVADGNLFWGSDSLDLFRAYIADPAILQEDEMHRVSNLPEGARR